MYPPGTGLWGELKAVEAIVIHFFFLLTTAHRMDLIVEPRIELSWRKGVMLKRPKSKTRSKSFPK